MTAISRSPQVSVVVPAFNAESSIDETLESVFAQTYRDFEVIVVDDGSTDGTGARLAAWSGRIIVLRQANGGPARARNTGIMASRGELVAFLDADDVWLPDKLARQVRYFEVYPQAGLLHTAALNEPADRPRVDAAPADLHMPPAPRGAFCDLFHTDLDINTLTVMVPRAVLDQVGLFDERREIHVEDWDLWLRIAARYPIGYLPGVTALRRPGGIMSSAIEKTFDGQAAVIRKNAPLCQAACPLHPSIAGACMNRRWHRLHWERGYARLRAGDRAGARSAFLAALRHRPSDLSTYLQLAGTLAGNGVRRLARSLRRTMLPGKPGPSPAPGDETSPRDLGVHSIATGPARLAAEVSAPPVSLVHDTYYRRVRHLMTERLHDLDDLVSRHGEHRRILFQAASPMSFVIFKPVYEKLRTDPRLEFWFTAAGSTWEPGPLFERAGIHENVVPTPQATWMKVDACINADFWDTTWLRRRTRRVHLFHGVAGKYGLDAPTELAPIVAAYDRLLFPNRDRLDRYVEAGLVRLGSPEAVLAGYPKVDRLVDGSLDVAAILEGLALDRGRTTVMYAPTWSPHSSLNVCGEAIIDRLAEAGFNVIVKLHDRSYDLNPRGSGGVNWASRLAVYRDHPLVRVVTDPDSTPFLAVSDTLVTDHSSVGFEFALLDRPIVVIDCPKLVARARVTPSKVTELRAAAEVVEAASQVVAAVTRQLERPTLHEPERRALSARYFYQPGTAALRAAVAVYEVLGLAAPETSVAKMSPGNAALASAAR